MEKYAPYIKNSLCEKKFFAAVLAAVTLAACIVLHCR